jgi:hypothetical protein
MKSAADTRAESNGVAIGAAMMCGTAGLIREEARNPEKDMKRFAVIVEIDTSPQR